MADIDEPDSVGAEQQPTPGPSRLAGLRGLLLPALAVAGLLIGTAAGAAGLVGSSGGDGSTKSGAVLGSVAALDCPGGATALALHRGDRVLVVGRDKSGSWVQMRDPSAPASRIWVEAAAVNGDRDLASVPIVSCGGRSLDAPGADPGELAAAPTTEPEPASSTTTPGAVTTTPTTLPGGVTTKPTTTRATTSTTTATTATTVPGDTTPPTTSTSTTPTTTPGPDTTPPTLGAASASPADIWEEYAAGGGPCVSQTTSTISVTADDASDIASVTMAWHVGNGNSDGSRAMTGGRTRSATLGAFPNPKAGIPDTGADIAVTITATDIHGNKSTTNRLVRLHSASECIG